MKFLVWCPEESGTIDDARTIDVADCGNIRFTAEEAARRWAAWSDWHSNDYNIVSGHSEPIVEVAPADNPTMVFRFQLYGESQPVYTAKEIKCSQ